MRSDTSLYVNYQFPIDRKSIQTLVEEVHPAIPKRLTFARQESKNFCFIKLQNKEDCDKIFESLQNKKIDGQAIFVSRAKPKTSIILPKPKININIKDKIATLIIKKLPDDFKLSEISESIPNTISVEYINGKNLQKYVKVVMKTSDALILAKNERFTIRKKKCKIILKK